MIRSFLDVGLDDDESAEASFPSQDKNQRKQNSSTDKRTDSAESEASYIFHTYTLSNKCNTPDDCCQKQEQGIFQRNLLFVHDVYNPFYIFQYLQNFSSGNIFSGYIAVIGKIDKPFQSVFW